jgi:hypothetical protein
MDDKTNIVSAGGIIFQASREWRGLRNVGTNGAHRLRFPFFAARRQGVIPLLLPLDPGTSADRFIHGCGGSGRPVSAQAPKMHWSK